MQDGTVIHGVAVALTEAVEEELPGNEGMLELNKLMDDDNRTHDYIMNNWIISPSRSLFDFQTARHGGLPLALCSRSGECSNQIFLDFFSSMHSHAHHQEMITINNITDLTDKNMVYSRDGWLLFSRPSSPDGFDKSLFVHNIITGEYIDLPDIKGPRLLDKRRTRLGHGYAFSTFSSSSSAFSVDYVVHVNRNSHTRQTTIYVTRPDTGSWEVYSKEYGQDHRCKFNVSSLHEIIPVVICGKKVYVFDRSKIIDVFDLVDRRWWSVTVTGLPRQRSDSHVTEIDGKIVKIYVPIEDQNQYRFSKLDWDDEYRATWVQMSESELENKSWFLNYYVSRGALCVKGCGAAAVYQFTSHLVPRPGYAMNIQVYDLKTGVARKVYAMNIQVYDLKTGVARKVLPFPAFFSPMAQWVDLGYYTDCRG